MQIVTANCKIFRRFWKDMFRAKKPVTIRYW